MNVRIINGDLDPARLVPRIIDAGIGGLACIGVMHSEIERVYPDANVVALDHAPESIPAQ